MQAKPLSSGFKVFLNVVMDLTHVLPTVILKGLNLLAQNIQGTRYFHQNCSTDFRGLREITIRNVLGYATFRTVMNLE
jgi:hypothetical protein